ncbi:CU044_2847 family protein [Actinomadura flavalba]|uniref:CU044_2847 family protein n=1 Tax=Actinomadura flavalba TaxID=1120938 RepID=UPI00037151F7|nr:CU044_2847 family protein [Actinomadura flavalba]
MLMRIPLDDGAGADRFMVVEVDRRDVETEDGVELVADDGPGRTARALRSLAAAFDDLEPALDTIVTRLRDATRGPDQIVVEFGLKFGGETGIIFTKGKMEAALKVTVTWNGEPAEDEEDEEDEDAP